VCVCVCVCVCVYMNGHVNHTSASVVILQVLCTMFLETGLLINPVHIRYTRRFTRDPQGASHLHFLSRSSLYTETFSSFSLCGRGEVGIVAKEAERYSVGLLCGIIISGF